jgi:hypothetical protein
MSFSQTIELDQELIDKKINALNLHRMKYDLPPFDVEIETILPTEFEAQKPADALSFDAGYVDANGKVYVSEPTSAAQLEVFTDIDQTALYYVCQSFLQYYYQTSEMPIWFKCGFAAYESDMRLDDNDIKTAYNNYGGTLTSFDALNDPTTFLANNGFAISYIFGEYMGVYNIWQYHMILEVNSSTIIPVSWWWNIESLDKLFEIWSRYFNARILEENEQNRIKLGQETEHFKFYYRAVEDYWAAVFPGVLEEAITEYMGLLDFEVFEKFSYITMPECDFAFIDGVECINRYTGGTAWSSGLSTTRPNDANDFDVFSSLIRHELGHLTQPHLPLGNITQWLNEGYACFMEGRPFTQEEIVPLQAATEKALNDATNYFGHLPTFEDTRIYTGTSYDYYLLGTIMLNFIYEDGGYSAVKDIMIDPETGTANLGYSSLEAFMAAYYFYLDVRILNKNVATLNTSLEDGAVYSSSLELNWTPLNPDIKLNVSYSIDGGNHWSEIKSNTTETNGLLEFPVDFYGEFYLKFSTPSILNLETIDGPYQRVNADVLTLLSPIGGEFFIFGDTENIQWGYTNITTIKIEYSTDNGSNWIEVSASTLSSSESYDWIIPNENSNQCLLKISDVANPAIFDVSDNTFEILLPNNAGGPYTSDDNTMLLLHFNGGLVNNSLLSDDGVPNGNTISYSSDVPSNLGHCLNLDGSSYITIPHNENLDLTGDWTIEAWIKITAYPTNTTSVIVRKPGDTESYYSNYAFEIHPWWGNILHGLYFSDTQTRINITDISPALNKWYHIAYIRDVTNSQIKIIVHDENWDVVSTKTNSYPTNDILLNSQDIRIGESFNGYMDELRISNIVRSFENIETGIQISSYSDLISLYPNPSSKNIYISSPEVVDISIMNITGQKIIEINNFSNGNIDISNLKKGVYIVVFSCKKGIASKKLIIE